MAQDNKEFFRSIDDYIERLFVPRDKTLTDALRDSEKAELPKISVSPNEGRILYLLARITGAKRILEIGLLGGYSTIWLARALPSSGKLVSLELEEKHAKVARKNLKRAGVDSKVTIKLGPAAETMAAMIKAGEPPFDFVFIDADKTGYPAYLELALKLTRSGSVIIADNVIRNGGVLVKKPADADLAAVQKFNKQLAKDPRVEAVLVPIIRSSIDGIAIARVK